MLRNHCRELSARHIIFFGRCAFMSQNASLRVGDGFHEARRDGTLPLAATAAGPSGSRDPDA
jgi:hypothetical protein